MIKKYINYRRHLIYFYFSVDLIFLLINSLYGLQMESTLYSILIISFLLMIFFISDYIKFRRKMACLNDINMHLSTDRHLLPDVGSSLEMEYQQMISSLYELIQRHVETMEGAHAEQEEYYTMWVHQIKTPISAMRLALQSFAKTENSELLEQELFKIEQYVELALSYTKMMNLSNDLVIREYSLEEIVNHSIKKYASLFIFKKLSLHIEEFHEIVLTDSKWLSFLLEQLISNAVKYTNRGGITITWHNHTLKITDTGIGIRKEDIERIFEKGYTGYNGRLDKKASGIGLYLTKKVAASLALKVSISSKVGEGTTAFVTFPEVDSAWSKEKRAQVFY